MLPHDTRQKIKSITSGDVIEGQSDYCSTIRNSLCRSFGTSTTVKKEFESKSIIKKEQAKYLEDYCDNHKLWYLDALLEDRYLTRGGEARVYLDKDNRHVIKINDAIYYATWLEFFNSLVLHNLIFVNTIYRLLGFIKEEGVLCAVLEQSFICTDGLAEIPDVKKFLENNGFENMRRNDYFNRELGLILEDMHDENVLVNSDTLFFIDSVFYIVAPTN